MPIQSDEVVDPLRENKELLGKFREEILRRQLSNSDNFDKAILSLATGFLGFSLAFLKDFVPYSQANCGPLLIISWIALGLAVASTMLSFFSSQIGLATQLSNAEKYYLKIGSETPNSAAIATDWLNKIAGACFLAGVVATIAFTSFNVGGRAVANSNDTFGSKTQDQIGNVTPEIGTRVADPGKFGAPIPQWQKTPVESPKSAPQEIPKKREQTTQAPTEQKTDK